jgi:hypothetical protein
MTKYVYVVFSETPYPDLDRADLAAYPSETPAHRHAIWMLGRDSTQVYGVRRVPVVKEFIEGDWS